MGGAGAEKEEEMEKEAIVAAGRASDRDRSITRAGGGRGNFPFFSPPSDVRPFAKNLPITVRA